MMLELDEPMTRQFSNESKLGGLHNHDRDPRKAAPLGTILKNVVEYKSGVIVHNKSVQNLEQCSRKKHSNDK